MAAKKKPERKKPAGAKADAPMVQARLDEVLQLRLDGAARWDICGYVREKEAEPDNAWSVARRGRPLSESQIERYIQRADEIVREQAGRLREEAFARHLAQRQARYAACVLAGDNATALACLKDEAKLLDLYPAEKKRHEHSGKDGKPIEAKVTDGGSGLPPVEAVRIFLAGLASRPGGGGSGPAALPADGGKQPLAAAPAPPQAGGVPAA